MTREFATGPNVAKWSAVATRVSNMHPDLRSAENRVLAHLPLSARPSAPPTPRGDREEAHPSAGRHTKRPSTIAASTAISTVAHSLTRPRVAACHRRRSLGTFLSSLGLPLSYTRREFPPAGEERSARARAATRETGNGET